MGYTTDFSGNFSLKNKPLSPKMIEFLKHFNETRRMARNQPKEFGIQGEFYVGSLRNMGQDSTPDVIDHNSPPSTQPGLWCQWTPSEDGTRIEWDGGEKFYYYTEWLLYLIHKILKPNGYILQGQVTWQGEETGDVGEIYVEDNKVFIEPYHGKKKEVTIKSVTSNNYVSGKGFTESKDFMRPDVVLIIDGPETPAPKSPAKKVIAKKVSVAKKPARKKSVTIKIEGLKADLTDRELKTLMTVIRQYTEGLVDKKESEYTLKHKKTELKAR